MRVDATTSWHSETARGRCDKRQHNLIFFQFQTELIFTVAVMLEACIEYTPEQLFCVGDES